jgi:hypothetical protein
MALTLCNKKIKFECISVSRKPNDISIDTGASVRETEVHEWRPNH